MAFNGSGTFNLPAGNPVSGVSNSSVHNTTNSEIAAGLTNCVTRDGQSPATANIPMGGFKLTGLAASTSPGESVRHEQLASYAPLARATFTGLVDLSAGANIASAATVDLTTATGNCPRITGTTPTAAVTMNTGQWALVVADGAWPLTYHATTNKLNTDGQNYTLAAGDLVLYHKDLSGVVHGIISPVSGSAVKPASRNVIINGGFTVNQRSYVSAATLGSAAYGHDRWKGGALGGNYSFTQLASNTTITIAAGKSLIQVIENKNVHASEYVLSWEGTAQARYAVNSATPSGSYAASPVLITGQTAGTTMSVEFNEGTLGKVQLTEGKIASSFENRNAETELALCRRYTRSLSVGDIGTGQCVSTTVADIIVPLAGMRTAPGVTFDAAANYSVVNAAGTGIAATVIALQAATADVLRIRTTVASGLVAGDATKLSNTTNQTIITAEL